MKTLCLRIFIQPTVFFMQSITQIDLIFLKLTLNFSLRQALEGALFVLVSHANLHANVVHSVHDTERLVQRDFLALQLASQERGLHTLRFIAETNTND